MKYLVTLNGNGRKGNCPHPDELESLIKAALAAVPEYAVFDIHVERVYTGDVDC